MRVYVCACVFVWGVKDYSCFMVVGSGSALLPISHSHEPELCRRAHWEATAETFCMSALRHIVTNSQLFIKLHWI